MSGDAVPDEPRMERDELRVRLYETLHDQVERERQWRLKRMTRGMAIIAGIVAVALVVDLRFLSLTPVIYGVVVMDGLKSSVELLYLERHMGRLEAELREREPLFNWVTRYGTFGPGKRLEMYDVDLNVIPNTALTTLLVAVYFALVAVSLQTWTPLAGAANASGALTRTTLLVMYAVFTVVFLGIVGVGYLHFQRVERESLAAADGGA